MGGRSCLKLPQPGWYPERGAPGVSKWGARTMLRFQAEQAILYCIHLDGRTLTHAEIARPGDLVAVTPDPDDRRAQRGEVLALLDIEQRISYRLIATIPLTKAVEQIAASARDALPPWLAMALYGAARAWGGTTPANITTIARFMVKFSGRLKDYPSDPHTDAQLDDLARRAAASIFADQLLEVPAEPVSLAKLLFAISRLAWDAEFIRALRLDSLDRKRFAYSVFAMIESGAVWLWPMVAPIRIGEARMDARRTFTVEAVPRLWPIWWGLIGASEDEARACLTPFAPLPPSNALIEEPPGSTPPPTPDEKLCAALARQIAEEAVAHAAYAPQGVFEAVLPDDLPLVAWGVARLRLVALRPGRLWAALLSEAGETIAAFPWRPDGTRLEGGIVVPDWAWGVVDLALSALWRDMVVAGPAALPGTRTREVASQHIATAASHPTAASRPLYLPRPRYALIGKVGEKRAWGEEGERAIIRRRVASVHAVRGHYRRHEYVAERQQDERAKEQLKRLREAAAARAAQFGLPPPPPGYTFVSPFMRGMRVERGDEREQEARDVRARGLAALAGVLATQS